MLEIHQRELSPLVDFSEKTKFLQLFFIPVASMKLFEYICAQNK